MDMASIRSTAAVRAAKDRPPEAVSRPRLLRAMARSNLAGCGSILSVSRLGARRWHIRLSPSEDGRRREIYLSPDDGGLIFTSLADSRLDVRLDGTLTEDGLRNLGDCLIQGLCDETRHIRVWLGRAEAVSAGACGLFESLGRQLAREGARCRLDLHGQGAGVAALAAAFRQGQARVAGSGDAA